MPQGSCFFWNPWWVSLHAGGNLLVASAFFAVAAVLYPYSKRGHQDIRSLGRLLIAFLVICGLGQGLNTWAIWHSPAWLAGIWTWITAAVGIFLALQLKRMLPTLMKVSSSPLERLENQDQDALTGVANRQGLEAAFDRLHHDQAVSPTSHTLMFLDLDCLRQVNDAYGVEAGDTLLIMVSQVLCDRTRSLDTVARWGGDEFMVLLRGCSVEDAINVGDHLREAIGRLRLPCAPLNPNQLISVSIGITEVAPNDALETCCQRAAQALHQAKQNGQNQISTCSMDTARRPINA